MDEPKYWGTYFRSTTRGGNSDRLSVWLQKQMKENKKDDKKAFTNSAINKNSDSGYSKTGAFHSPFCVPEYENINKQTVYKDISDQDQFMYDLHLEYKKQWCEDFKILWDRLKNKDVLVSYKHKYPCLLIKVDFFEKFLTSDKKKPITNIANWYYLILSFFIVNVNKIAEQKKIPIELTLRSSFGHNNPTVDVLHDCFRINIGLIPKIYSKVLIEGLNELVKDLNTLKNTTVNPKFCNDMNVKINNFNFGKPKVQQIDKWTVNLFEILKSKGDKGRFNNVLAQITRFKHYSELLTDYLYDCKNENKPINVAFEKILGRLNYGKSVSLKCDNDNFIYIKDDKKMFFNIEKIPSELVDDSRFRSIIQTTIKSLDLDNSKHLLFDKNFISAVKNVYKIIESLNIDFIKNSGKLEIKKNYNNESEDSDVYVSDAIESDSSYEQDSLSESKIDSSGKLYAKKIIVSTGMRAINLSAFLSIYYISKNYGIKNIELIGDRKYYETSDSYKTVKNIFSSASEILNDSDLFQFENEVKGYVEFIDLNHCDDKFHEKSKKSKTKHLTILDYTSAKMDEIRESVEKHLSENSDLLLIINSGIKNEQCGCDLNPYGTLRIISDKKEVRDDIYNVAMVFMKFEISSEFLPKTAHQIRKAYKVAKFISTNKTILNELKYKKSSNKNLEAKKKPSIGIENIYYLTKFHNAYKNLKYFFRKKKEDIFDILDNDKKAFVRFSCELDYTKFEKRIALLYNDLEESSDDDDEGDDDEGDDDEGDDDEGDDDEGDDDEGDDDEGDDDDS